MTVEAMPTGEVIELGAGEIFFSTTDHKGVITSVNSVFERISQYPRAQLLGSPHNIVRHPEMPSGVFKVMWDRLAAGQPVAAYVKNLSATGATYSVFAVILPIGDQMLSIRSPICAPALEQAALKLYKDVLHLEHAARSTGASKSVAAELGSKAVLDGLKSIGFPSYDSFIKFTVPAETTERLARPGGRHRRPESTTGPLRELLDGTDVVHAQLSTLVARLGGYHDLAERLLQASEQARGTAASLRDSTRTASNVSITVADKAPVLARAAGGMLEIAAATVQIVESMALQLNRVRHALLDLRYRIGVAQLVTDQVVAFAAEMARETDRGAVVEDATLVRMLCDVLTVEVTTLAHDVVMVNDGLLTIADNIVDAGDGLLTLQKEMATWRLLLSRYGVSGELDPYISPINNQLGQGYTQMHALRELGAQCVALGQPFDPTVLRAAAGVISETSLQV